MAISKGGLLDFLRRCDILHPLCALDGWCGLCYTNRTGRTNAKGHSGYRVSRPFVEGDPLGVVKRRTNVTLPGSEAGPCGVDEWLMAMPSLAEFLTSTKYEDGAPRQCPTITVFYDHPLIKVCLNDRDQGVSCWVSSAGLQGAFLALERGLEGDCLEWRKPPSGKPKRR